MTIDVGTGDGRAVLAAAARDQRTLAIGLDASAPAMAESSRRAAQPAAKGGSPNAAFIVASAEAPPAILAGSADLVTVQFPWGSLLRGCVGSDERVAVGVAGLAGAHGELALLLAPSARDGLDGIPSGVPALAAAVVTAFEPLGFEVRCARPATPGEIAASGSTWARRLGAGRPNASNDRQAVLVRLARR